MRRGFMDVMLKPKCSRRSGWGKGLLDQKKHGWVGQRSRWCLVRFLMERHWPPWVCTTWTDGKQTVVPGSFSAYEGCCAQEEAWLWGNQTCMLHHNNAPAHSSLLIRSYLAKYQTSVVPHLPYSPDLASAVCSSFLNLKPFWKDVFSKP